jgi:hypothetical protein
VAQSLKGLTSDSKVCMFGSHQAFITTLTVTFTWGYWCRFQTKINKLNINETLYLAIV